MLKQQQRLAAWLEHRLGGKWGRRRAPRDKSWGTSGSTDNRRSCGQQHVLCFILFMESKCHTQIHVPPEPQDVMLFEKSPFVDIISYEKVIQDLGVVVAPTQ